MIASGGQRMIPKRIGHIWIGPHPAPEKWMQSWREKHPGWEYRLYDNDFLLSRRFRNQHLINEYVRRGKWAGVSDLMRYEILFDYGGFLPEADSICLHPVDDLFADDIVYTVYEYPDGRTGMMSPFLAAPAQKPLLNDVIEKIGAQSAKDLNNPWHSTGNGFLKRYFAENPDRKSQVHIFPSHYFIPQHYKGERYVGPDRIYAEQCWGTTTKSYDFRKGATAEYKAASNARSRTLFAQLIERHPCPVSEDKTDSAR
ncbi:MAG: glycosyltransferase [Paracoccus sp. (in: a-proteobacteria)]|nr:glycosyltransferase [Paracoccus sp. (in: a-proteobacteria)]